MILVDSDILIAHLRGVPDARSWLREARLRSPLSISVATVAEMTGGMRSAERREVWALLNVMRPEPVTELVARRAGELRRRFRRSHTGIGIADYLVAATALELGAELATLNVKHFPMFDDLRPPFEVPLR